MISEGPYYLGGSYNQLLLRVRDVSKALWPTVLIDYWLVWGKARKLAMDALHFQAQGLSVYNNLLKDGVRTL